MRSPSVPRMLDTTVLTMAVRAAVGRAAVGLIAAAFTAMAMVLSAMVPSALALGATAPVNAQDPMSAARARAADELTATEIAQHGDGQAVLACSTCHGQAGEGNASAGFPRLAGLPETYLAAQLEELANGVRQNAVMEPVARALSAQQRTELARYYSKLASPRSPAAPAQGPLDDRVALHGRWDDEIPACVDCHGANGSGVGQKFPALAGQSALYVASQLRAWKADARRGDPLGLMQAVANRLTDQDVQAVADYFAAQPLSKSRETTSVWSVPYVQPSAMDHDVPAAASRSGAQSSAADAGNAPPATFTPNSRPIPDDDFGQVVRSGRDIFEKPSKYAQQFVGNELTCTNCHLDAGRHVGSAPLWAAYVSYPAYRAKNHHVNTFEERLQGCFQFSMNGKAPPLGDPVLVALESYAYWMAQGAPLDPNIPGRGYPKPAKPALPPDYDRGGQVYARSCALCHGEDGAGQRANDGSPTFPALWGAHSFNWGAGMGSVNNAAAFIKANMPLGLHGTLSDQDAWDVALFMDSHERPQDPRYTGSVADTRARFHDGADWMYGKNVNGHVLGSDSVPPGPRPHGRRRSSVAGTGSH